MAPAADVGPTGIYSSRFQRSGVWGGCTWGFAPGWYGPRFQRCSPEGLYLPDFLEHRWGKEWQGVAAWVRLRQAANPHLDGAEMWGTRLV